MPRRASKVYYIVRLSSGGVYFTATRGAILAILIAGFPFACIYLFGEDGYARGKFHRKSVWYTRGRCLRTDSFLLLRDTAFVQSSPVLSRFVIYHWTTPGLHLADEL